MQPAVTQTRDFPRAGGLMSYGGDFGQSHRQSGLYAGRILKGEKPGDIASETSSTLELHVNPGAAQKQGITLADELVKNAAKVIQ